VVGALGPQAIGWDRGVPEALALAAALRDPQALLPPDALHPLAVDLPALVEELGMSAAVSPPRSLARKPAKTCPECRVVLREDGLAALG